MAKGRPPSSERTQSPVMSFANSPSMGLPGVLGGGAAPVPAVAGFAAAAPFLTHSWSLGDNLTSASVKVWPSARFKVTVPPMEETKSASIVRPSDAVQVLADANTEKEAKRNVRRICFIRFEG